MQLLLASILRPVFLLTMYILLLMEVLSLLTYRVLHRLPVCDNLC